jgi:hypothetical protein
MAKPLYLLLCGCKLHAFLPVVPLPLYFGDRVANTSEVLL